MPEDRRRVLRGSLYALSGHGFKVAWGALDPATYDGWTR
jgi:hypothetical protein